jgi:hypothetical protein
MSDGYFQRSVALHRPAEQFLDHCHYLFSVGHGQPKIGDIVKTIGRSIVKTSANGPSPSASICTSLTIQATRPPLVRHNEAKNTAPALTPQTCGGPAVER